MEHDAVFRPILLRINLTTGTTSTEELSQEFAKKYIGGVGYGVRLLYDDLPPGTGCFDPENRIVWSLGPLTGTLVNGSGLCCVNTKGPLTEGLCSAQSLGHFGALLRHAGYNAMIVEGAAPKWSYVFIGKNGVEIRSAEHLRGLDTWDTEDALKEELGLPGYHSSVACIGPAGENLVRFAGIFNDKGHLASSNGPGAVMGSKKLKAIVIERQFTEIPYWDKEKVSLERQLWLKDANENTPSGNQKSSGVRYVGTLGSLNMMNGAKLLPVKNYTEKDFPTCAQFNGDQIKQDDRFRFKRTPCWACSWNHCHSIEIVKGKYAGMVGDEPEYEGMSAMSALIGNFDDTAGALMLNILTDRMGMDVKETGFLLGMVFECYECGILTKEMLGGLEMNWGDCDAAAALIKMIVHREGIGDILAEGVKRSVEAIGNDAEKHAVYLTTGFAPHIHDQRMAWSRICGFMLSDYGSNLINPVEHFVDKNFGIHKPATPFHMEEVTTNFVKAAPHRMVDDALGVCIFYTQANWDYALATLNAATGWGLSMDDLMTYGYRMIALMRCLNLREGKRAKDYNISHRLREAPQKGDFNVVLADEATTAELARRCYEGLGWDPVTSCPLPETLRRLGLEDVIEDMAKLDFSEKEGI